MSKSILKRIAVQSAPVVKAIGKADTCEFWQIGQEVFRCSLPIVPDVNGLPSSRRWESSIAQFEQFRANVFGWVRAV